MIEEVTMKEIEKFFKKLGPLGEALLEQIKGKEPLKTTEESLGPNKKKIQVELPAPPPAGGFAGCPSGDNEYDDAMAAWQRECNVKVVAAIPKGYSLKSSDIKEERIVRHYADIIVEKS